MSEKVPASDDVAAHSYRMAQANRLIRYCEEIGVDPGEVMAGRLTVALDPICDETGKIKPEPQDYH